MQKTIFAFNEDGSVVISKGSYIVILAKREVEVFKKGYDDTHCTKSDYLKFPYKIR